MENNEGSWDAAAVAQELATALDARDQEYALGGAIALGYWGAPRGTVDVDLTLYLPADKPSECLWLLGDIGCDFDTSQALESLQAHGFCRTTYQGLAVDVFLPTIDFYEAARPRRQRVELGNRRILIWDAETLAVFKMMFFRRKDLADVEQILRAQGAILDRSWVRQHLLDIYGQHDPRLTAWDELCDETSSV